MRWRLTACMGVLALCSALGCAGGVTQIVLVIESELSVPEDADTLSIIVIGPSGERTEHTTDLRSASTPRPPYTLGLVSRASRLGPVFVRVRALREGTMVVERSLRTEFIANATREVRVRLERACMQVDCEAGMGCEGGICLSLRIPSGPLAPLVLDAGPPCAAPAPETCNRMDDDCDGRVDEEFDLLRDPSHCGACGSACPDGVACQRGLCGDPATSLALGEEHTCVLRASGHIACWGANEAGQLGGATTLDAPEPIEVTLIDDATALSSGERHACAIRRDRSLWCWGWNQAGQLGDGTTTDRGAPAPVGLPAPVVQVSCGYEHTCVRLMSGDVYCWGSLQRFDATSMMFVDHPTPLLVEGLLAPLDIEAGNESNCARESDESVVCWGRGADGRLGDGTTTSRALPAPVLALGSSSSVSRLGSGYYALDNAGRAWGWGANGTFQLAATAPGASSRPLLMGVGVLDGARTLVGGRFHGCALLGPQVLCWGLNARGQIARPATVMQDPTPEPVTGLPGSGIVELATGSNHTCVRTASALLCWGDNGRGQLGDGSTTIRRSPVRATLPGSMR